MTPPKRLKPRKRLGHLLDLIASLEEANFCSAKALPEHAARADSPDSKNAWWEMWHEIFDGIERCRAREPSG